MPPDPPSSTDGAGRTYDPQDDRRVVVLDREQRDWLRAAEDLLVELAQTEAAEDPAAVFECAQELKSIYQAFDSASALLAERERTRVLEEALREKLSKMHLPVTGPFTAEEQYGYKMAVDELQGWLRSSLAAVAVEDDGNGLGYETSSARPVPAGVDADAGVLREVLRDLVEQIDLKFPKGQSKRLPGPSLYVATERARRHV